MNWSMNNVSEALAHVRELQKAVLERQRFRGFSGRARMVSGSLALLAAAVMASSWFPQRVLWHILGWGGVFVMAFFVNAFAILFWYLRDAGVARDSRAIRPVIDVIPPIAVGGVLTATMILHGHYQFLFGIWMCLFGLTNMATRMVVPRQIWIVGLFYLTAGALCLLPPNLNFLNPWPMGIIFFAGEMIGGLVLHYDGTRYLTQSIPATPEEEENYDATI